jgi:hypothetical protein
MSEQPTMIELVDYRIRLGRPLSPGEATLLRGYFGNLLVEEELLHQHRPDGRLRYQYPLVQYKVRDRQAQLLGLGEACPLVVRLWGEVDQAILGDEKLPILEGTLRRRRELLGQTETPVCYRFLTPWLGLNQDNFLRYQRENRPAEKQALRERILVGNCLSLAKSFGHRVSGRLVAGAGELESVPTRLKGVPMLGFIGRFTINFSLPEHVGIGKSVSRGFGTVERVE